MVQARITQLTQTGHGLARLEKLQHLIKKSGDRDVVNQLCHLANRRPGLLLNGESELCRKPHGAQHSNRIFTVTRRRISDHADQALF